MGVSVTLSVLDRDAYERELLPTVLDFTRRGDVRSLLRSIQNVKQLVPKAKGNSELRLLQEVMQVRPPLDPFLLGQYTQLLVVLRSASASPHRSLTLSVV